MTGDALFFDGKKFISAKRASQLTGYTSDYIGQISRAGKLSSRLVGRARFVDEEGLVAYYNSVSSGERALEISSVENASAGREDDREDTAPVAPTTERVDIPLRSDTAPSFRPERAVTIHPPVTVASVFVLLFIFAMSAMLYVYDPQSVRAMYHDMHADARSFVSEALPSLARHFTRRTGMVAEASVENGNDIRITFVHRFAGRFSSTTAAFAHNMRDSFARITDAVPTLLPRMGNAGANIFSDAKDSIRNVLTNTSSDISDMLPSARPLAAVGAAESIEAATDSLVRFVRDAWYRLFGSDDTSYYAVAPPMPQPSSMDAPSLASSSYPLPTVPAEVFAPNIEVDVSGGSRTAVSVPAQDTAPVSVASTALQIVHVPVVASTPPYAVSITDLAIVIDGLRKELLPKIDLAMQRPRASSRSSSGSDDDDLDADDLAGYLALSGGTLTGNLAGTDAAFSGALSAVTLAITGTTTLSGVAYDWPDADGISNQVLTTDGAGGLSWETASGGGGDDVFESFGGIGIRATTTGKSLLLGSASATSSNAILEIIGSGYVSGALGIGTTSPYAKLSVDGDFAVTGGIYDTNATRGTSGQLLQSTGTGLQWVATSTLGFAIGSDLDNYLTLANWYATTTDALDEGLTNRYYTDTRVGDYITSSTTLASSINYWTLSGSDIYRASGNVGIGTTTPTKTLEVVGSQANTNVMNLRNAADTGYSAIDFYDHNNIQAGSLGYGNSSATFGLADVMYYGSNAAKDLVFFTNGSSNERMRIMSGGNVGIGTTSPYAKLSVAGPVVGEYFHATSTAATSTFAGGLSAGGSTGLTMLQNGTVDIGGDAPIGGALQLEVRGKIASYGAETLRITSSVEHSAGAVFSAPTNSFVRGGDTLGAYHAALAGTASGGDWFSLIGQRMGGNDWDTTPSALTAGDYLPGIGFAGQTNTTQGTGMVIGAAINGMVDGTVSSGVLPTSLIFRTSATSNSGLTEYMRITSGGNVGIGTTSPYAKLSVAGQVVGEHFTATSSAATSTFSGGLSVAGTGGMTVLQNGRVGIGAMNPSSVLQVGSNSVSAGTQMLNIFRGSNGSGNLVFRIVAGDGVSNRFSIDGEGAMTTNGQINFTGGGFLGSSGSNINGPLTIGGTTRSISAVNSSVDLSIYNRPSGSGGGTLTIGQSGETLALMPNAVGVGTTTPWRTLSVVGTVGLSSSLTSGTTGNYLCIDTSTFEVTSGTTCSASSERFKEHIVDLAYGLDEIKALRPVTFSYRKEYNPDGSTRLGLIAEEVHDVIPEVVNRDKEGRIESVSYDNLIALLIKGIQEIAARLDAVEAQLASAGASVKEAVATFGEVVADTIRGKKVMTETLCLGETCVTETELKELLEQARVDASASATTDTDVPNDVLPPLLSDPEIGTVVGQTPLDTPAMKEMPDIGVSENDKDAAQQEEVREQLPEERDDIGEDIEEEEPPETPPSIVSEAGNSVIETSDAERSAQE